MVSAATSWNAVMKKKNIASQKSATDFDPSMMIWSRIYYTYYYSKTRTECRWTNCSDRGMIISNWYDNYIIRSTLSNSASFNRYVHKNKKRWFIFSLNLVNFNYITSKHVISRLISLVLHNLWRPISFEFFYAIVF